MKKLVRAFLFILMIFTMVGCGGKTKVDKALDTFKDTVENAKSYKINGEMKVIRDSGEAIFDVCVLYEEPSKYKVSYQNKSNNSKQILLKNASGVYVLIPELNKQFKFESAWPLNSSHIYILETIVNDLNNDEAKKVTDDGMYYVLESSVNHKIKKDIVCQKIYLSKEDYGLKRVTYNTQTQEVMTFDVSKIEFNLTFSNQEFNQDAIMESETSVMGEGGFAEISQIIFGDVFESVSLVSQSVTEKATVLNYDGDKQYFVLYSVVTQSEVTVVERIFEDLVFLDEGIAFVSQNCLTFYRNNREFKIISQELTLEEMISVANSLQMK